MPTVTQRASPEQTDGEKVGVLRVSWPPGEVGTEFSPPDVVQRARMASSPVFEVGIAVETTLNPVD